MGGSGSRGACVVVIGCIKCNCRSKYRDSGRSSRGICSSSSSSSEEVGVMVEEAVVVLAIVVIAVLSLV
jgi:hypothetical protein